MFVTTALIFSFRISSLTHPNYSNTGRQLSTSELLTYSKQMLSCLFSSWGHKRGPISQQFNNLIPEALKFPMVIKWFCWSLGRDKTNSLVTAHSMKNQLILHFRYWADTVCSLKSIFFNDWEHFQDHKTGAHIVGQLHAYVQNREQNGANGRCLKWTYWLKSQVRIKTLQTKNSHYREKSPLTPKNLDCQNGKEKCK